MSWRHMGSGSIDPPFLTSALDGGEWSASRPGRYTPGDMAPGTHWIWGWGGSQSRSKRCGEEKILLLPGIDPRPTNSQAVAIPTELSRLLLCFLVFRLNIYRILKCVKCKKYILTGSTAYSMWCRGPIWRNRCMAADNEVVSLKFVKHLVTSIRSVTYTVPSLNQKSKQT
jgi:hypothetical protein